MSHKVMTFGELAATDIVFVTVPNPNIPEVRSVHGLERYGFKIPNALMIKTCIESYYRKGSVVVNGTALSGDKVGQPCNYEIPKDTVVHVLQGEAEAEMRAKWQKGRATNLIYDLHHTFPIGSDPEVFVTDKDDTVLPAFDFLGSKEKPNKTGRGEDLYWDGFQAEFTTVARGCLAYHVDSIQRGLRGVLERAKAHSPGAKLSLRTVMPIPPALMDKASDEHTALGCMPSLNAYGLEGAKVAHGRMLPVRSAGGHIHFGLGKDLNPARVSRIVKALDAVLGVACVSLFEGFDHPERRQYYGLAGEYRLPPHGLEYRTLSNAWLSHPMITNLVFDLSRKAVMFGDNDFMYLWKATEEETIRVIQTCDVAGAREIMERNKDLIKQMFRAVYGQNEEAAYQVFFKGMASVIKDPTNLEANWQMTKWVDHNNGNASAWAALSRQVVAGQKIA